MAGDLAARVNALADAGNHEIEFVSRPPGVFSLADEFLSGELFEGAGVGAAFQAALESGAEADYFQPATEPDSELHQQLAQLTRGRGLNASAEELVVTAGAQQGLELLAATLVDPGDVVLVERACPPAARRLFALTGAVVVPVECDVDGLVPDALEQAVDAFQPKLVYAMPTFQNPTGATLTAERRAEIAEIVRRGRLWLIEDDPYSELRYAGDLLEPLASHEPERVAYLSTLSTLVGPGLRVGWIACGPELRAALSPLQDARDMHASALEQRAAALCIGSDDFPAHLQQLQDQCQERFETLGELLPATLGSQARWSQPDGGLFVWAQLAPDTDAVELLHRAQDAGVVFSPGPLFDAENGQRNAVRLSVAGASGDQIGKALKRLGSLLEPAKPASRSATTDGGRQSRTTMTRSLSSTSGVTSSVSSNFGGTRSVTVPRRNRRG